MPFHPDIMKKLLIAAALLVVTVLAGFYFSDDHQRYLTFDAQRDAWHRKCDVYIDQPIRDDQGRACRAELAALTAYAKRQGWTR